MKNKSFTLIELLVVIVIIGILASVIIVSVSSLINKANFAKAQAFSNTVQQELLSNLVSEWTFDDESNLGEDSWGGNDGTVYGLPEVLSREECVYRTCVKFDGVDDSIVVSHREDFNFATKNHTISLWINTIYKNTGKTQHILTHLTGGVPGQGYTFYGTTTIYFQERATDGEKILVHKTNYNDWHLYTAIANVSSKTIKLYLDGGNPQEITYAGDLINSNNNFYLSGSGSSYFFSGILDDVRIYNAALSTSQIKQEYIAGLNSLLANNNISKEEYDQRLNNLAQK